MARGERLTFIICGDGSVRIEPARSTLESVAGSFVPLHAMSDDFDAEIDEALADEADRRMQAWRSE